ncbi:MAG: hypothetical protein OEY78_00970 [Gammaproteobacteria bacterium]|nr:hypothetical protein [Gammaproteobacteria bacterium]
MLIRYTRHNEVPLLHNRAGKMDALYFNHVQTALKKLGPQIRLRIPKLKHLELIIQRDVWVVVDLALSEFPILCWTNFQTEHRDNLHQPIGCEVRYFHYGASMIYNKTIEGMELMLGELLGEEMSKGEDKIVQFKV